jgi:hypothetical protein
MKSKPVINVSYSFVIIKSYFTFDVFKNFFLGRLGWTWSKPVGAWIMQGAFCIVFLSTAQKYFCIQMEISNGHSFPMQSGFFGSAVLRDNKNTYCSSFRTPR